MGDIQLAPQVNRSPELIDEVEVWVRFEGSTVEHDVGGGCEVHGNWPTKNQRMTQKQRGAGCQFCEFT